MTTFADLVRQYRSDAQLSQEALAERAGVSTRTVSDIECGVARAPRAITISLLAEALDLADAEKERLRATVRRTPVVAATEFVPFRLPSVAPHLIGRETETAAAADVLTRESTRLVTFLGGAGVGKTSLALNVAHAIRAEFAGGVLLVEMAAIPDPAFVPTKIAFAAQVRDARGESTALSIAAALRGRRTLLVLDTCEHVAGAAPFIAELLAATHGLTIAATSRVPLRLAAEVEFGLGPLPVPAFGRPASHATLAANPTVALLIDRIRELQPAFALNAENAADIAELARLLEGNPLAVGLAAPLLVSTSPAALADQLQRRLPLLVTTGADLPPRQRTMRDAIGWSYELLTDPERRIFRRLSVFRGSFGAELAHTVAGEAGHDVLETLRAIAVLVEQNLLQVLDADDGEPRFVFLEMVREYGAELLAKSDESEATYLRLGHSALATAGLFRSNLPAAQMRPQFESLTRESATFDAVLTWARDTGHVELGLRLAVQLWDFWWFCGSYAQAAAWLDALLTLAERGSTSQSSTVSDELLARAYNTAAGVAEARGGFSEGEVFARKALPLKRKIGDFAAVAALLSGMGVAASERGDYARARELLGEGLAIRRDLGHEFAIGKSLFDLGQNAGNEGDIAAAQRHLEDSLQCFRNVDSQLGVAFVFAFLGIIAARGGLADRAESFGREALRLGQAVGHQAVIVQAKQSLAAAALHRGAYDEAERGFHDVLQTLHTLGDTGGVPELLEWLAATRLRRGDAVAAAMLLGTAHGWRRSYRLHVYPALVAARDRLLESVRATLGEQTFSLEFAAGEERRGAAALAHVLVPHEAAEISAAQ